MGDAKPSDAKVEAPKKEGKGAATEAFGQVRDAIPGSTIETAVGYVPGGGLATSGFKAAKGIGGLGFALGSAGATAVSKKRKKSKAGRDTEAMDNEAEIGQADGNVATDESSASRLPQGQRDYILPHDRYGAASTTYYSGTNDGMNQ
ncbi:hypothetical protein H0H92_014946, partial [Tricholoma furcatifolium]